MTRIIAFDGIDCTGKTTVIESLKERLIEENYIPYVFHLTSPDVLYKEFFVSQFFTKSELDVSEPFIQWSKFIECFNNIKVILAANPHNIVLLDRTPFSQPIWNRFFDRGKDSVQAGLLTYFLKYFETLNEEMLFVNLNVNTEILTQRILLSDNDRINFINAFNRLYSLDKPVRTETDEGKISFMIYQLKEEFNRLFVSLSRNQIDVKTFDNNIEEDFQHILDELTKINEQVENE